MVVWEWYGGCGCRKLAKTVPDLLVNTIHISFIVKDGCHLITACAMKPVLLQAWLVKNVLVTRTSGVSKRFSSLLLTDLMPLDFLLSTEISVSLHWLTILMTFDPVGFYKTHKDSQYEQWIGMIDQLILWHLSMGDPVQITITVKNVIIGSSDKPRGNNKFGLSRLFKVKVCLSVLCHQSQRPQFY